MAYKYNKTVIYTLLAVVFESLRFNLGAFKIYPVFKYSKYERY